MHSYLLYSLVNFPLLGRTISHGSLKLDIYYLAIFIIMCIRWTEKPSILLLSNTSNINHWDKSP